MVSCNYDLFLKFTENFMCVYYTTLLLHGPWCHHFRSGVEDLNCRLSTPLGVGTPKLCQTLARTQQRSIFDE